MSVLLMGMVWGIELNHQEQAVMLALADHAYDDGTKIFPSVGRIAWKTGYTRRNVQYVLRTLESKSLIIAVAHERGGRGKATEYIMKLENGTAKAPYDPEKGEKYDTLKGEKYDNPEKGEKYDTQRVKSTTQRVKSTTLKGETGFTPTIREPSENHHENHHAHTREDVSAENKEIDAEPEPETAPASEPLGFTAWSVAYRKQHGYAVKTSKLMGLYREYRASVDVGEDAEPEEATSDVQA